MALIRQKHKMSSQPDKGGVTWDAQCPADNVEGGRSTTPVALLATFIVIVAIVVMIAHWPALSATALSFDDNQYLTENPLVQNPSWSAAGQFLAEILEPSTVGGYYQPLTMISLMLDHAGGGRADNFFPFHRTSLVLHVFNTALIIVLLYMLFGQVWAAAMVGLLFGVHPMTVEPIPWIGERKTLLAAFFALWSLIAYLRYTRTKGWAAYGVCLTMYVLALMSKPISTPLPVCMLLLDFWPLRRLSWRSLTEKVPFFVLGVVFSIITIISQGRTASVTMPVEYSLMHMLLVVCHNIIFYPCKMIFPVNLSAHYAFPEPMSLSHIRLLAGVVGTCVLIQALLISLRWTRALLIGWLFFFLAIFPTIGIIGFTVVIASDKYAYLPSVGLMLPLTYGLAKWWQHSDISGAGSIRRVGMVAVVLLLAAVEICATRRYLSTWQDTESHYQHMIALTPKSFLLHDNLGIALKSQGKLDQAISHYHEALRLNPHCAKAHNNLGIALESQDKLVEAVSHYSEAIRLDSTSAEPHNNLGHAFRVQGKFDKAIRHLREAVRLEPDLFQARRNLGNVLIEAGQVEEAIRQFHEALQLKPYDAPTHNNLGAAYARQGRIDDAIRHFHQALHINPDFAEAHKNLGNALAATSRVDDALRHFREAIQLKSDFQEAMNNMAWILATHPDVNVREPNEAVHLAERAASLSHHQDASVLDTLAAAYAAAGQFDRAVITAQKAIALASAAQAHELADNIRKRLDLYKQQKPYRQPSNS